MNDSSFQIQPKQRRRPRKCTSALISIIAVVASACEPPTNSEDPASQLTTIRQPSPTVRSGDTMSVPPAIQLADASGNSVRDGGIDVTVTISTGDGELNGTTTVEINTAGVATFVDLSITGQIGDRTLEFSVLGLPSVRSNNVNITAGAASQLLIATQPSATATNGAPFSRQPVASVSDASGNSVNAIVAVTVTIAEGPGGTPTLTNATTMTNARGLEGLPHLLFNTLPKFALRLSCGPAGCPSRRRV